ncbi:Proliferating cell nuclear antigen PCNA [Carpediemonas membranifera]|uniref:DNA sliding clamp PCNA n=1 Tax=Carpediemonas membranifera TaxID=201153 RepID=A0A8J6B3X5_9EUKA|nr:Proliferating cell nuclear antigen PCNA [Carpediemonas membranifera]|eukprot:KAG9392459.1 Proliferating cell nuclear antigen PCNA [Carpediemonas membranifera]
MFEALLEEAGVLKRILDAVKELVNQANVSFSPTGITIHSMDSSCVALLHLVLCDDGFQHFRCDASTVVGINFVTMSKILKGARNDDSVTIRKKDEDDFLTLILESKDGKDVVSFEMKEMDIDAESLGVPETEYEVTVSMDSASFQNKMRYLAQFGDAVTIEAEPSCVKFSVNGEQASGSISLRSSSSGDEDDGLDEGVKINRKNDVSLSFALRYLQTFTKATTLSNRVRLSLSNAVPLSVSYDIEGLGFITYYLAPKIDDDEDDEEDEDEEVEENAEEQDVKEEDEEEDY